VTNTAVSDFAIAFGFGVWLFMAGMSSVWRDARQQLGASR